jgi:hypothetical protein
MSATYTAVSGQSLQDVCMITYGSPDYLVQLANDNGITDLNNCLLSGVVFTYDNSLVVNQVLQQQLNQDYGTAAGILGFYETEGGSSYYESEDGDIYIPE